MKNFVIALGIFLVSAAVLGCGQQKAPTYQPAPVSTAKPAETVAVTSPSAPSAAAPKIDVAVQPAPVAPAPAVAVAAPAATGKEMVIADFNTGDKPNNVGGDFGSWDKDPNDPSQGTKMSFNPDEKYGKDGFSLQLDYDVDSPNPAYNGFWMKLGDVDASYYNKLVLYIKGDEAKGYPQKLKVELKNANGEVGKAYITQISGTWAPVEVPFSSFQGIKDFSKMTEFTIVFEDSVSRPKAGTVYIDNIGFARD
ncbi:MAG TPA: carbohydrate binding domain-containing protein [Candidatus Omnitrophota bacterium]|nr:hypothetical protein [Candidatus Omnitrophota bacterium]HOX09542.1 carbohydrate binding domain-containing protein [Candidatus Omnitrophota bacterium]HPN66285.1 carbohydrate binding domain-containing protein [Candidatus Omnitrophota bacterium]HRZ67045.1 carbohydrate binding domain-containing protein [Candidatus Omnitrophota bacterium]